MVSNLLMRHVRKMLNKYGLEIIMKSLQQYINESINNVSVSLGLPSKTKWNVNISKKRVSFKDIENIDTIPSKDQFKELIKNCDVKVEQSSNKAVFIGKNGGSLVLPLVKGVGYFWSSTPSEDKDEAEYYAYCMKIDNSGASLECLNKEKKMNVVNVSK